MEVTKEIIDRFFKNEAEPQEMEAVKSYFEENPDQAARYAREMEQFTTGNRLHPAVSESMFTIIEDRIERKQSRGILLYRMAAAAAVILAIGATWTFFISHKENRQLAAKIPAAQPRLLHLVNTSDTIMHLQLADGSSVQLYQHSGISWYEPFINNRRDVSLNGIGLFKVAKDKTKPFTVYAGGIGTTALGTQFKVNADCGGNRVIVQLYEGKVVVKQVNGSAMNYLLPGQQLVFNSRLQRMAVARMEDTGRSNITLQNKRASPAISKNQLVFTGRPFIEVIAVLKKEYHVNIEYRDSDIKQISVTAEFKHTDPVLNILNAICMPNGLSVSRKDDTYIIQ